MQGLCTQAEIQRVRVQRTAMTTMSHKQQLQHLIDIAEPVAPCRPIPSTRSTQHALPAPPAPPAPRASSLIINPPPPVTTQQVMAVAMSSCVLNLCSHVPDQVLRARTSLQSLPIWMGNAIISQAGVYSHMSPVVGQDEARRLVLLGCLRSIMLQQIPEIA